MVRIFYCQFGDFYCHNQLVYVTEAGTRQEMVLYVLFNIIYIIGKCTYLLTINVNFCLWETKFYLQV